MAPHGGAGAAAAFDAEGRSANRRGLAAALHHSRGVGPDDTNNAQRGRKPASLGMEAELFELYDHELPDRLAGVGPQERVQRHATADRNEPSCCATGTTFGR